MLKPEVTAVTGRASLEEISTDDGPPVGEEVVHRADGDNAWRVHTTFVLRVFGGSRWHRRATHVGTLSLLAHFANHVV